MAPQLLDGGMGFSKLLLVILFTVATGKVKSYKLISQSLQNIKERIITLVAHKSHLV